ncbi:hypothetical protein T484DRAFT_1899836, partial [Baffinella frigidus]
MVKVQEAKNVEEAVALIREDTLKELSVHPHAELGDAGATKIADVLRQAHRPRSTPQLVRKSIGPDGAEALGVALNRHTRLQELHLHENRLGFFGRLQELHLHKNRLGFFGVQRMSRVLAEAWSAHSSRPGNKVIRVLVLRDNGIAPCCGDCALCRGGSDFPLELLELSSLETLDLNNNALQILPLALARSLHKLKWLDIRNNVLDNVPEQVFMTARRGHAEGWPVLKEFLLEELEAYETGEASAGATKQKKKKKKEGESPFGDALSIPQEVFVSKTVSDT